MGNHMYHQATMLGALSDNMNSVCEDQPKRNFFFFSRNIHQTQKKLQQVKTRTTDTAMGMTCSSLHLSAHALTCMCLQLYCLCVHTVLVLSLLKFFVQINTLLKSRCSSVYQFLKGNPMPITGMPIDFINVPNILLPNTLTQGEIGKRLYRNCDTSIIHSFLNPGAALKKQRQKLCT